MNRENATVIGNYIEKYVKCDEGTNSSVLKKFIGIHRMDSKSVVISLNNHLSPPKILFLQAQTNSYLIQTQPTTT